MVATVLRPALNDREQSWDVTLAKMSLALAFECLATMYGKLAICTVISKAILRVRFQALL